MDRKTIKFNAACIYKNNIYFSSNEVSGLLALNMESYETEYLAGYEDVPHRLAHRNREIYLWKSLIFTFPWDGDTYDIYDTRSDKIVRRFWKREECVCVETCEIDKKAVVILEYDMQKKSCMVLIMDYKNQKLQEWNELSELMMQVYDGGTVTWGFHTLASSGNRLIAACKGTSIYFEIDFTDMQIERKEIAANENIHSVYLTNDSLFILTLSMKLIKIDCLQNQEIVKVYAPLEMDQELLSLIWFKNHLFALRCYDDSLYKIVFNEKNYGLSLVAEKENCMGSEASPTKYKRLFLGKLEYDNRLFLLPFHNETMSEYVFEEQTDSVRRVDRYIRPNTMQMEAYYKSRPFEQSAFVFEEETLGGSLYAFIRSIG